MPSRVYVQRCATHHDHLEYPSRHNLSAKLPEEQNGDRLRTIASQKSGPDIIIRRNLTSSAQAKELETDKRVDSKQ